MFGRSKPAPETSDDTAPKGAVNAEDAQRVRALVDQMNATGDVDEIIVNFTKDILGLFDAERLTVYAVDYETKELVSKFLDTEAKSQLREIRIPIDPDRSIAGFVAMNRVIVRVQDAYDADELSTISPSLEFDRSWDEKTGFRTKQMLTLPVISREGVLVGVIQLVNIRERDGFDKADEEKLQQLANSLGISLYNRYQWMAVTAKASRRSKFDLLVTEGLVSKLDIDAVTTESIRTGEAPEDLLAKKNQIPRADIARALAEYYDCPAFALTDDARVPAELVENINPNYLRSNFWVPLDRTDEFVEVLIDDPTAFQKVRDIQRVFPGLQVKFRVALRADILELVNRIGGAGARAGEQESTEAILGELRDEELEDVDDVSEESVDESSSAIVRLANRIILDAYRMGASDIHIEPGGNKLDTRVRIRIDGVCKTLIEVPPHFRRALVSRLKIMAKLDIAERRRPQDGKIRTRVSGRDLELRVATIPSSGVDNEDVVLRILASGEPLPIEKLTMTERNLSEFRELVKKPYGIFLCVGPTGSGKTTTLHAALGAINDESRKIWTAEDPVEITQAGLRQVQVNPKIGFNFAAAMRSFLRADPDVIMVGEMRDQETAETAIEASLTGHLVFSTLHTNSAAETITRLLEMEMDPFSFADSLLGVLAQRLVRTLCPKCKAEYQGTDEEYEALANGYGREAFTALGIAPGPAFKLHQPVGCEFCGDTGYRGRVGIHELLVASDSVKTLVRTRASVADIHAKAMAEGMTTLLQDGILKILSGFTDAKQVWAVAMR